MVKYQSRFEYSNSQHLGFFIPDSVVLTLGNKFCIESMPKMEKCQIFEPENKLKENNPKMHTVAGRQLASDFQNAPWTMCSLILA